MERSQEVKEVKESRIIDLYLNSFVNDTESTTIHHRWCFLSITAALLGRKYYFPLGHGTIFPNMYTMLMGEPATRKSTAIKIAEDLLRKSGYDLIAKGKTSHEKFLMDLGRHELDGQKGKEDKANGKEADAGGKNFDTLWGAEDSDEEPHELFVSADEFNNFIGLGNYSFISTLGELWDCKEEHPVRFKNSTSFNIHEPVVNILGGNTQTGFCLAFPPEIIGQGFFSRLLLIHADPSGRRITFPKEPSSDIEAVLIERLKAVRSTISGRATLTKEAEYAIDYIYQKQKGIDDVRFQNYAGRRLTHMVKLALLYSALELRTEINEEDIVLANSTLCFAEGRMPQALGEYGKGKNSDVAAKILSVLETSVKPLNARELWASGIAPDLEKIGQLAEILVGLKMADKIMEHAGGFLIKRKQVIEEGRFINFDLLIENVRR